MRLVYKIWNLVKALFYIVLTFFILGLLSSAVCSLTFKWPVFSYFAQIGLSALSAAIVLGMIPVILKDYGFDYDNLKKRKVFEKYKRPLTVFSFLVLSTIFFLFLQYTRNESAKQSFVITIKNPQEKEYTTKRVTTNSPFEIKDNDKTISFIPKMDSTYVVNLSDDTLQLSNVVFNRPSSEPVRKERYLSKTVKYHIVTVAIDTVEKVILPHSVECCGIKDDLDIFREANPNEGLKRKVLKMKVNDE